MKKTSIDMAARGGPPQGKKGTQSQLTKKRSRTFGDEYWRLGVEGKTITTRAGWEGSLFYKLLRKSGCGRAKRERVLQNIKINTSDEMTSEKGYADKKKDYIFSPRLRPRSDEKKKGKNETKKKLNKNSI